MSQFEQFERRHLSLNELKTHLAGLTIDDAYKWLGASYSTLLSADASIVWEVIQPKLAWLRTPTLEEIKRLFNQINSYYAERFISSAFSRQPDQVLLECNRLTLYKQLKLSGIRTKHIEYGIRSHLDFLDPWRRERWLRGIAPSDLKEAVSGWCSIAGRREGTYRIALLLSIALIAIHPFSDGNGRVARLMYTWLCGRWGLARRWLNEADSGEVMISGHGIQGTTYLMAMLTSRLMNGNNEISPGDSGRSDPQRDGEMIRSFCTNLLAVDTAADNAPVQWKELTDLDEHMVQNGHYRFSSPRFECLTQVIEKG